MIRLVSSSGAELRIEDEAQAEFWRSVGYRELKPEQKKAPAKRAASKK